MQSSYALAQTVAPGWAGQGAGTTGGAGASLVRQVTSAEALRQALLEAPGQARIIRFAGTLDFAAAEAGGPYASHAEQARRGVIKLPANTSLIGSDASARLMNVQISIRQVHNVIVRNFSIVNPCDVEPQWDPKDGKLGNWNSEFDAINIDAAQNVWIDHLAFSDAPITDDQAPVRHGRPMQCHDGALDIKNAADFITVSNTIFDSHQKNNLIGHSDSASADAGHLRISFMGNLWRDISERAPRVRYGQVHVFNNLYQGDRHSPGAYAHKYSIGVAQAASVLSENNVFDIRGASSCADVVRFFPASIAGRFEDRGSLIKGAALRDCPASEALEWAPPYAYSLLPSAQVRDAVLGAAGPR